jgi:hypothetical protein
VQAPVSDLGTFQVGSPPGKAPARPPLRLLALFQGLALAPMPDHLISSLILDHDIGKDEVMDEAWQVAPEPHRNGGNAPP